MSQSYIARQHWLAPITLLITLLLRWSLSSDWIEQYYSRTVFTGLRYGWDYSLGMSPVPLYYVFWGWIFFLFVRWIIGVRKESGWRSRMATAVGRLFRFCCWLVVLFLWGWGFNYGRNSVERQLNFTPYDLSFTELTARVRSEADTLRNLRMAAVGEDTMAIQSYIPGDEALEAKIRKVLSQTLLSEDYPAPGRPRGRQLHPKGVLLRLGTSGVYWPWVGEGNLDAGLHPLKKPSVLAHELAHAYGFGEEGTCSFWAWKTGQQLQDDWLAYAIRLDYWRNLARQWLRTDRAGYLDFYRNELSPGIRQDIIAIVRNNQQYPDLMPAVRDATYETYLKSQGVKDGLLSYGRVVKLVEGYRKDKSTR